VRVARLDAVEVAVLGVVRFEAVLLARAGLNQPDLREATTPTELVPLPEEKVFGLPVVHRSRRLDLELPLVRAVVRVPVLDAGPERDAETVAASEVQDRGQGDERWLAGFLA